ncbi:MAG: thiamine pyrophosphate-dependent dehydrogenase E1 component subunit alpha [Bdellovibrionales bacterium]|nr:thiamine pyrophosphate-dependent dehydrogenase E1 component subunit alpha [Bdellovibrionales bacterium]
MTTKPMKKSSLTKLDPKLLAQIHDLMVRARALEERMIRMYKQNEGYFWLGGPGEEAFNVPLGLQINKGQGLEHEFLHLHYRSSAILLGMGMEPMDALRQMKNTATDPFSGGRNFVNHYSIRKWNVVPVTSTIETQYATAIGTGLAQRKSRRPDCKGITIVNGGDAGTAEGEFASSLVWSTRPGEELPILFIVTHNAWGISTAAATQHGEKHIADRARAFGMPAVTINGTDVEESWAAIEEGMKYVREERKPYFIESKVSRLYGHSSASGANRAESEKDPLPEFEAKLEKAGVLTRKEMDEIRERYEVEMREKAAKVKTEPMPDPSSIYDFTYYKQRGKYF